jgi:hypothetical protein
MPLLEDLFPDLKASGYQETSPIDQRYNCIAWAAGHQDRWWESAPGYFWPVRASHDAAVTTLVKMFESLGFKACDDESLELGVEKVAIYSLGSDYTHAARQLPTGRWASKIGALQDIEHDTLDGLVGAEYGAIDSIMKRPTTHTP